MTIKLLKRRLFSLACVGLILSAAGCTLNAHRAHPQFDVKIKNIKAPVLMPPDVNLFELSAGGVVILRDDWTDIGRRNLENAVVKGFKGKDYTVMPLVVDARTEAEISDIHALYRLIHKTMKQQTFGPARSASHPNGFEYSLGPIESILQRLGADSMIFVSGWDRVSRGGRKALIDLAIADPSGTILYYSVKGSTGGSDLRNPQSAAVLVQELLAGFSKDAG